MADPTPPTVEQLQSEIATLKAKIGAMVPGEEKAALQKELEATRKELADVKASAGAQPNKSGFFPRLF